MVIVLSQHYTLSRLLGNVLMLQKLVCHLGFKVKRSPQTNIILPSTSDSHVSLLTDATVPYRSSAYSWSGYVEVTPLAICQHRLQELCDTVLAS